MLVADMHQHHMPHNDSHEPMLHETSSAIDWFPPWLTLIAAALLALAALHHVPCILRGQGNRWFHLTHIAMCSSMIYMYLIMAYPPGSWGAEAARAQMWFFVATTGLIVAFLISLLARRRSYPLVWLLLAGQQAGMIYMWLPMHWWSGTLTVVVGTWFLIETAGWLAGIFAGYRVVAPVAHDGSESRSDDGPAAVHLSGGGTERLAMAFMALSMAYMFFGMQAAPGFSF